MTNAEHRTVGAVSGSRGATRSRPGLRTVRNISHPASLRKPPLPESPSIRFALTECRSTSLPHRNDKKYLLAFYGVIKSIDFSSGVGQSHLLFPLIFLTSGSPCRHSILSKYLLNKLLQHLISRCGCDFRFVDFKSHRAVVSVRTWGGFSSGRSETVASDIPLTARTSPSPCGLRQHPSPDEVVRSRRL
jgi:hypothetical protein